MGRWRVKHRELFKLAPHLLPFELKKRIDKGEYLTIAVEIFGWQRTYTSKILHMGRINLTKDTISFEITKTDKHYFRMFDGFGVNKEVIDQMVELDRYYDAAIVLIHQHSRDERTIYRIKPADWQRGGIYSNPMPPKDDQYILSLKKMENITNELREQRQLERQDRIAAKSQPVRRPQQQRTLF